MNRVQVLIERIERLMQDRIDSGVATPELFAERARDLDIDVREYVSLQNQQALAFASDKISMDESLFIYNHLRDGVTAFNNNGYAIKAAFNLIHLSLLTYGKITTTI